MNPRRTREALADPQLQAAQERRAAALAGTDPCVPVPAGYGQSSGQSGDVLHLTIKVLFVDPVIGGNGFVLSSFLNGQNNLWFAAIGQN